MFQSIPLAPPDSILGLTAAYKSEPNPNKVNLGVGVYKDASGQTPILKSVKLAEERLLQSEKSKSYLPIDGAPEYGQLVQALMLGPDHEVLGSSRAATAQTPGGTGALRVAADFVKQMMPEATVWISDPTWANHPSIFEAAGLPTRTYPYYDPASHGIRFVAMLDAIQKMPAGDVLLLHGCCHNPTGVDLNPEQWRAVAQAAQTQGLLVLLDFAYQGFGSGLVEDALGLHCLVDAGLELLVASSFSKNFGLYNERIGALTAITQDAEGAERVRSQIKRCIRTNYSNPPAHGGAIVQTVLGDPELRTLWESEVTAMRERINSMRHLFVETLNEKGAGQDFSFIAQQRGMFSFSGLTPTQVQALRERHGVYIVGSGRINVAGLTESNMDYLCAAIADVVNAK